MDGETKRQFLAGGEGWTAYRESGVRAATRVPGEAIPLPFLTPGIRFVSESGSVRFLSIEPPPSGEAFRGLTAQALADMLGHAR